MPSPTYHETRTRCKAHNKSGKPCGGWAIKGATVCYHHGGAAPQVRRAAAQRVELARVNAEVLAHLQEATPIRSLREVYAELLEVAGVARAWRQILTKRVSELKNVGYKAERGEQQIRADVQLFERALDRSAKIGELIARLNLDERKAALDGVAGAAVAELIKRILNDLDLSEEQAAAAPGIAAHHLRELAALGASALDSAGQ